MSKTSKHVEVEIIPDGVPISADVLQTRLEIVPTQRIVKDYTGGEIQTLNSAIAKLDYARTLISDALSIDEALEAESIANAVIDFKRQLHLTDEIVHEAEKIRSLAQLKFGEHLLDMPKNHGGRPEQETSTNEEVVKHDVPTYDELGIDYKTAAAAQQLAQIERDNPGTVVKFIEDNKVKLPASVRNLVEKVKKELPDVAKRRDDGVRYDVTVKSELASRAEKCRVEVGFTKAELITDALQFYLDNEGY
ncbi:MAG: hypothetical protein N4J56_001776 [Chroococcidiopsis sp. SAG 2025]|uniref:hypothetical protein n=1 Tax=Chroococcidiopsis sp. SAG 2025 TaxID=171389 RepID=UPI00293741C8|nr:hypothetical protein [Chroococcidiopsis sp. SAG 2025]MDV2992122.1 hypothetical protein [Chroococcidiopsis sp. SAG 2025]